MIIILIRYIDKCYIHYMIILLCHIDKWYIHYMIIILLWWLTVYYATFTNGINITWLSFYYATLTNGIYITWLSFNYATLTVLSYKKQSDSEVLGIMLQEFRSWSMFSISISICCLECRSIISVMWNDMCNYVIFDYTKCYLLYGWCADRLTFYMSLDIKNVC